MLGREHEIRRAENRIGARREHRDRFVVAYHAERQLSALRAADPVLLRGLGNRRPIEPVQVVQQTLGIRRDTEKPLLEETLLDGGAAPLAQPAFDLLVGEHSHVGGAPVHGRGLFVREALLVELQEHPLRPLVVVRARRVDLLTPIDHQPRALELPLKIRDILGRQLHRVRADLERVVLRVDPERIVAERLEHIMAQQPVIAGRDVAASERKQVPHVQPFGRRIREHHERVERTLGALEGGMVRAAFSPSGAPLGLDQRGCVGGRKSDVGHTATYCNCQLLRRHS